jgi:hypothetical protein
MDQTKIENAIKRLEQNLPIRHNQARLPAALRQLHQSILRYYLEHGKAPVAGDLSPAQDWDSGVERLAAEHIIVLDDKGEITGAYPFVNEMRNFRVISEYGQLNAMCAFDALAVSSMFGLPTRIESHCHVSNSNIVIEQNDDDITVIEPQEPVFAAINWGAAVGASSCSATLCCEMIFITGEGNAASWLSENPGSRELFELAEAHVFISAVFVPLMR